MLSNSFAPGAGWIASIREPEDGFTKRIGVSVWLAGNGSVSTAAGFVAGDQGLHWYRVAEVPGEGAWWLPTVAGTAPPGWAADGMGGAMPLAASGSGVWSEEGERSVLRPKRLLWWLPEGMFEGPGVTTSPAFNRGAIGGDFPSTAPPGSAPSFGVAVLGDGVRITVPPWIRPVGVVVARGASGGRNEKREN